MKCCGKERNSRYCPECGKKLKNDDVIYDILEHCRFELNKHKTRQKRIEDGFVTPFKSEKEKLKKWIAKWESWEKAILEAIKSREKIKRL